MDLKRSEEKTLTELDLECRLKHAHDFLNYKEPICNSSSDSISCWPPTPVNQTVYQQCFSEFLGYKYNDTQNASRVCLWNGTWSRTDYTMCIEIMESPLTGTEYTTHIYFAGHMVSLIALAIAIGIFLYFKDLRCLRNTVHVHLMCAYFLHYFLWIINLISKTSFEKNAVSCVFLVILLHYFHSTTFFWMFVEGLYLYILVVETLTRENFKLRVYVFIGWGLPIISITVWATTKCFLQMDSNNVDEEFSEMLWLSCPWLKPSWMDWIFQGPIMLALLSNFIFLVAIMSVLITKLRSANTVETQQYRKASKALLVLMPLLGITYVLTIIVPSARNTVLYTVLDHIRATFLSIQGFTVALVYCFLNREVQNAVRHHFVNWRTIRSLRTHHLRTGNYNKECFPNSCRGSIRCTEYTMVPVDDSTVNVLFHNELNDDQRTV